MFTLCPTTVNKVIFGAAAMALLMLGQKIGAALGPVGTAMIVENGGWSSMVAPCVACGVILIICAIIYAVWEKKPNALEREAIELELKQEQLADGIKSE